MSEEEQVMEQGGENPDVQIPQTDPEVEKRARGMGWIPKENFKGDPSRWRPAEEFVQRAEDLMPVMKAQMRKYEDRIESLQGEVRSTRGTLEKVVKISETVSQREYERAKQELLRQQAEAVGAGDTTKWMQLEQEKDKLEKPEPVKVEPSPQSPQQNENPEFRSWHEQNDWYLNDPVMTRYANAMAQEIPGKDIPYNSWISQFTSAVKEAFPHKFQNPNRSRPSSVDGGDSRQPGPGRPKSKTYNDLPAEAKAACDNFVTQKILTREQYVKDFFEEG